MSDNPNEIFDVVDADDIVIGTEKRGIVHKTGLLHRAVHILLFNASGECFLQKRSMSKDSCPGLWAASASGHLDSGESYEEAAHREVEEELGVPEISLLETGQLPASALTGNEFVRIYRGEHAGPFKMHPTEISDGAWYSVDRIDKWIQNSAKDFAPSFLAVWKVFRSRHSS